MDSLRPLLAQNRAAFTAVSSQYGMGVNDWDPGMACFSWGKCRDNIAEHFFWFACACFRAGTVGRQFLRLPIARRVFQVQRELVWVESRQVCVRGCCGLCAGIRLRTVLLSMLWRKDISWWKRVEEDGRRWKKVEESGRG